MLDSGGEASGNSTGLERLLRDRMGNTGRDLSVCQGTQESVFNSYWMVTGVAKVALQESDSAPHDSSSETSVLSGVCSP